MIDQDTLNKIVLLNMKWDRFKRKRNKAPFEFSREHEDYMTMQEREEMLNQVFNLIRK